MATKCSSHNIKAVDLGKDTQSMGGLHMVRTYTRTHSNPGNKKSGGDGGDGDSVRGVSGQKMSHKITEKHI